MIKYLHSFFSEENFMSKGMLKQLAQKAKKRLSIAGLRLTQEEKSNACQTTTYLSSSKYAIVVQMQELKEDPLYEKVKKLITCDEGLNPIAELTDHKIYDKLESAEKERYVINLSKHYLELKEYFLKVNN